MSLKKVIALIFMNKTLLVKLALIVIYSSISIIYFYDEHFPVYSGTQYEYGTVFIMIVAMSFGIIISAVIYNTSIYFYLKQPQYLYYALAQLSTLFFLITLDSLYIFPFNEVFQLSSPFLFDLAQLLMLFFSFLFLKSFFQNYHIKGLNFLFKILFPILYLDFILLLLFSQAFISKIIPLFITILLILSEIYHHVGKTDKAFNLILIGWGIVLITVILGYFGILALWDKDFPFFHIAIAIESIFLSLALAYKFKIITDEKEEQQFMLFQQSRLASMGTMISTIAHQWRQPLNVLSLGLMNIKKRSKGEEKNLKTIAELKEQLQYMSETIEDFKNFYKPSKIKEYFSIEDTCQKACKVAFSSLEQHNIDVEVSIKEDFKIYGKQNELEQVILSLINNSKDAFLENNIKTKRILIAIDSSTLSIKDNAGGIEKQHLEKIFDPYFSTKEKGEGIGLHISKLIVEKELQGKLHVQSLKNTTTFSLIFTP